MTMMTVTTTMERRSRRSSRGPTWNRITLSRCCRPSESTWIRSNRGNARLPRRRGKSDYDSSVYSRRSPRRPDARASRCEWCHHSATIMIARGYIARRRAWLRPAPWVIHGIHSPPASPLHVFPRLSLYTPRYAASSTHSLLHRVLHRILHVLFFRSSSSPAVYFLPSRGAFSVAVSPPASCLPEMSTIFSPTRCDP